MNVLCYRYHRRGWCPGAGLRGSRRSRSRRRRQSPAPPPGTPAPWSRPPGQQSLQSRILSIGTLGPWIIQFCCEIDPSIIIKFKFLLGHQCFHMQCAWGQKPSKPEPWCPKATCVPNVNIKQPRNGLFRNTYSLFMKIRKFSVNCVETIILVLEIYKTT